MKDIADLCSKSPKICSSAGESTAGEMRNVRDPLAAAAFNCSKCVKGCLPVSVLGVFYYKNGKCLFMYNLYKPSLYFASFIECV